MEIYKKIKELIDSQEKDIIRIYEKNQESAAIRVREALQQLRALAKELRQDIQDHRKRVKNEEVDNFQP